MAAPNLVSPGTIKSRTSVLAATTTPQAIVANAASSGKSLRIVSLVASNVDPASNYEVTVDFYRSSTATRMPASMVLNPKSAVVLLGRDAPLYLEEGDQLRVTASATGKVEAVCSYEEIY